MNRDEYFPVLVYSKNHKSYNYEEKQPFPVKKVNVSHLSKTFSDLNLQLHDMHRLELTMLFQKWLNINVCILKRMESLEYSMVSLL